MFPPSQPGKFDRAKPASWRRNRGQIIFVPLPGYSDVARSRVSCGAGWTHLVSTRFLHANRCPLRSKPLQHMRVVMRGDDLLQRVVTALAEVESIAAIVL